MVRRSTMGTPSFDHKTHMIEKLLFDLRVYLKQINNECETAEVKDLANARIAYAAQKITAVVNALENVHQQSRDPPTKARTALAPEQSTAVQKLVDSMLTRFLQGFRFEVEEMVDDYACEQWEEVEESTDSKTEQLKAEMQRAIENVREDIMDEDMVKVKDEVLANIKARKEHPDAKDTQDQLPSIGL